MGKKEVKTIFWFFEWSWAAIYNWNSAKFQTFSMSNVPPQLDQQSRPQQLLNYTGEDVPSQLDPGRPFIILYRITIDLLRADQVPLPAKLISAVSPRRRLQDIRASTCELASVTIKLRSLEGQAKPVHTNQNSLLCQTIIWLVSVSVGLSPPLSSLPQCCLGHQTLSKSNIIERSSGHCQIMDKIKARNDNKNATLCRLIHLAKVFPFACSLCIESCIIKARQELKLFIRECWFCLSQKETLCSDTWMWISS